jgi:hypothetical protein
MARLFMSYKPLHDIHDYSHLPLPVFSRLKAANNAQLCSAWKNSTPIALSIDSVAGVDTIVHL